MIKSESDTERQWLTTISLVVLAVVAIGFTVQYAKNVLLPFVLAIFIFLLISPILDMQVLHLKLPRSLAIVTTLLIALFVLLVLTLLLFEAVQTIIATTGEYSDSLVRFAKRVFSRLQEWGFDVEQDKLIKDLQNRIPNFVTGTFGTVVAFSSQLLLVLVFVIFLLIGRNPHVVRKGVYAEIDHQIRRYIGIKALLSILTGILVWSSLSILGLELAGVFGMLAFLLNFIPSIGSIIATLLPLPVAVAQYEHFGSVLLVLFIPGTVQMSIGNLIEPKLMGRELQLHPVTILLALSFWGLLWGIPGMFLAVPITASIRIVLMQFETLRPVGDALSGNMPKIHPYNA